MPSSNRHNRGDVLRLMGKTNMRKVLLLCAASAALLQPSVSAASCGKDAWSKFVSELVAGQTSFVRGDPASVKALWSHGDDITLMGAWGGYERGWSLIAPRLDWVSKQNTEGTYSYEEISKIVGSDLALFVQIEHFASPGRPPSDLRVTHVMRCEGKAWKIVSRHADKSVETKPPSWVKPRE